MSRDDSLLIAHALRSPFNKLYPSWPMPAGGIDVENVPSLVKDYGTDTVLLIGSSLYTRSPDLAENAARFLSLVK
jgi:ribulose 1,5-bisphosphate carboxylase large subunit-like protein